MVPNKKEEEEEVGVMEKEGFHPSSWRCVAPKNKIRFHRGR